MRALCHRFERLALANVTLVFLMIMRACASLAMLRQNQVKV